MDPYREAENQFVKTLERISSEEDSDLRLRDVSEGIVRFKHAVGKFDICDGHAIKLGWSEMAEDDWIPSLAEEWSPDPIGESVFYFRPFSGIGKLTPEQFARYFYEQLKKAAVMTSFVITGPANSPWPGDHPELKIHAKNGNHEKYWMLIEASTRKQKELKEHGFACIEAPPGIYVDQDGDRYVVLNDGAPVSPAAPSTSRHITPADAVMANPGKEYVGLAPAGGWVSFNYEDNIVDGISIPSTLPLHRLFTLDNPPPSELEGWSQKIESDSEAYSLPTFDEVSFPKKKPFRND